MRKIASSLTGQGKLVSPGIFQLTGLDPSLPELADPYFTRLGESYLISGTGPFSLRFKTLSDLATGGPYDVVWNNYFYPDGTRMEAASWDLKPTLWNASSQTPLLVWYGGRMRPRPGSQVSNWPQDNYSRDVFAFSERGAGNWYSEASSIFASHGTWPRATGNYLGHRYGHQIVMGGDQSASVYYEEVTAVRADGSPSVTSIFVDGMTGPFATQNSPTRLIDPLDPATGRYYPSSMREDGSALVEGPLYFRFRFEGEDWEAIGFSAGSYYARYPSCFAFRKVADGLAGKPYQLDLTDDGTDLHDAGAALGQALGMTGGPGRPAVLVDAQGNAILDDNGDLRLLVHGYRHDQSSPDFRVVLYAPLSVKRGARGGLRFDIPVHALLQRGSASHLTRVFNFNPVEARNRDSSNLDLAF